jgi:exodeoxyribonuclease V alpha subunit
MSVRPEILDRMQQLGLIGPLDSHFAALLCRLDSEGGGELALAAALTCSRTAAGDVCLDISQLTLSESMVRLPEANLWLQKLRRSSVVGRPGEFKPLVLDDQGRCYLYRYWDYEQRLGQVLLKRSTDIVKDIDEDRLTSGIKKYFSNPAGEYVDWQRVAAATALLRRFTIISGGPGTGKTTTVVKILALLSEQSPSSRPPIIALAAPTGKAAARLQDSIRSAKQKLDLPADLRETIPDEAATLHRLLGFIPGSARFRHNRSNPLPVDVLIVDEASMVDLALMVKTVEALPEHARLILLGDKDQLASVEAGSVLGDICGVIPGFSPGFAERVGQIIGEAPEQLKGAGSSPLADALVELRFSYRFGSEGGIGQLATAVNGGEYRQAEVLLQGDGGGELRRVADGQELISLITEGYSGYLGLLANRQAPAEVLSAFERFRVLCAMRIGPAGVFNLNKEVERILEAAGLIETGGEACYPGRPVLITRNDYGLRLFNGDIGILMPDEDGELKACFAASDARLRWIAPSRLPAHESAYCLTIHKSQGSEFGQVLLVMPDQDSQVLSRELLYTAITRAKHHFAIYTSDKILEKTISKQVNRTSGLKSLLWDTEKTANEQLTFSGL